MEWDDKQVWYSLLYMLSSSYVYKVPTDFSGQCKAVKEMLENDETGLVNPIINYAINSAYNIEYKIEVQNENLDKILNTWLKFLNVDYRDVIPMGIKNLAKEYYRERWAGSSLCIFQIIWDEVKIKNAKLLLPKAIYLIDGSSVNIKEDENKKGQIGSLIYELDGNSLENIVVNKPYNRWFDKKITPYLVKTGVLRNFYSIKALKEKSDEVIRKMLPYLLFLKKGTERLAIEGRQALAENDLQALLNNFKQFLAEYSNKSSDVPMYVAPFDTEITHVIPELKNILNVEIYTESIRAILSGLGFIPYDNNLTAGTSRREVVLNPKPFIEEVNAGIEDFKLVLQEIVNLIIQKNKDIHPKYFSDINDITITNSPLKLNLGIILDQIRMAYIYGAVSIETYCETLGLNFEQEKERRLKEHKEGLDIVFYPHRIQNPPMKDEKIPNAPVTEKEEEKETEKTEERGV